MESLTQHHIRQANQRKVAPHTLTCPCGVAVSITPERAPVTCEQCRRSFVFDVDLGEWRITRAATPAIKKLRPGEVR